MPHILFPALQNTTTSDDELKLKHDNLTHMLFNSDQSHILVSPENQSQALDYNYIAIMNSRNTAQIQ